ncbi:MAG: hypothetical protein JWL62_1909, partial [Hyphomicrobiales bacterium]|nr:hypothetical protein [Hyphomicrobiales bacterium]
MNWNGVFPKMGFSDMESIVT